MITRLTSQWQAEREAFAATQPCRPGLRVLLGGRDPLQPPAWRRAGCAAWCWWGCAPTAPRSWWRSPTASGESGDAWAELLRDCRRRGMRAPVVMVGDGALGLWRGACARCSRPPASSAVGSIRSANVLNALPKSVHAGARRALNEIAQAEDRAHAERAIEALVSDYGAKWPKAVAKVVDDTGGACSRFFDYPAEHWLHLRTTNPIESTFSPVRARTRVTKGPGNKDAGLAMVFKLLEAAEGRWRAVNGPHLVALVRAGARFEKGRLVERPKEAPEEEINEVAA